MKSIYLIRHAKAADRNASTSDFDRPLVSRGIKNACQTAKKLSKLCKTPDLFLSSPAARALETAHIFANVLDYDIQKIKIDDRLYESENIKDLMDIIKEIDERYKSIMLFGHNPSISELSSFICRDFSKPMPKSSAICIETANKSWQGLRKLSGSLKLFINPKENSK